MIKITARKKYGDRIVLDVSELSFKQGKIYAIIGANGSGKSTLLKVLSGQLNSEGERQAEKGLRISYMPQTSFAFSLSVRRNILIPVPIKERKMKAERADYLMEALGLTTLQKKNAANLSGGETQRVALARTLMTDANLYLLDEPTASMDVEQAREATELIARERNERGSTVIFSTHALAEVERIADEVLFLSNGLLFEKGSPKQIFCEPQTRELIEYLSYVR